MGGPSVEADSCRIRIRPHCSNGVVSQEILGCPGVRWRHKDFPVGQANPLRRRPGIWLAGLDLACCVRARVFFVVSGDEVEMCFTVPIKCSKVIVIVMLMCVWTRKVNLQGRRFNRTCQALKIQRFN